MDYNKYLASKHWRTIRKVKLKETPFCHICKKNKYLCVHHLKYDSLGEESMKDLMVLCRGCHEYIHFDNKEKVPFYRTFKRLRILREKIQKVSQKIKKKGQRTKKKKRTKKKPKKLRPKVARLLLALGSGK